MISEFSKYPTIEDKKVLVVKLLMILYLLLLKKVRNIFNLQMFFAQNVTFVCFKYGFYFRKLIFLVDEYMNVLFKSINVTNQVK